MRRWVLGLVLLAALGTGLPAAGQGTPKGAASSGQNPATLAEAQTRFKRATTLYEEGDFAAALLEFRRAFDLSRNPRILYNVAQVHYQLKDYAAALVAFERYLAEVGSDIDAKRAQEVREEIEKLRPRVARVTLSTRVEGVEVSVDDVAVGVTPFTKPLIVSAGRRKISALKQGWYPWQKTIEVAGGDATQITLDLVQLPAGGQPASTPPQPKSTEAPVAPTPTQPAQDTGPRAKSPTKSTPPWALWIASGALTTGAIVSGVLALQASSDLQDKRNTDGVDPRDLDQAGNRASNLALATDILLGAGLVTAGLALYVTLSPSTQQSQARGVPLRVSAGPSSLLVSGSF